jgi:hypothetical protein
MFTYQIHNAPTVLGNSVALRAAIFTYDLGKAAVLMEESIPFLEGACASATKLVEKQNQIGHRE